MDTPANPSIGFVGWNPFQFLHFRRVIRAAEGAVMVIEERRSAREPVDPTSLGLEGVPVLRLPRRRMREIDGAFDVIVCQTPFAGLEDIRRSRVAMLQYGYAKEAHNFGPWRSLGDLCLTFGEYASRKIEPFCPCVTTGNPRYEDWNSGAFRETSVAERSDLLDPEKPTVLYAPTWGGLSSEGRFLSEVDSLADQFNVIIKAHHNTRTASAPTRRGVVSCGTMDDIVGLLRLSNALVSDYSGAIFDAIHCRVPVVLLDNNGPDEPEVSRSDRFSLERIRRHELGSVVKPGENLARAVRAAVDCPQEQVRLAANLRDELFMDATGSTSRVLRALEDLAAGNFESNQAQTYIRNEMRAYFRCRNQFPLLRRLRSFWKRSNDGA